MAKEIIAQQENSKTFFAFIGITILVIVLIVAGVWIVREIASRRFSGEFAIQNISRRTAQPVLVNHSDLQDRKVFGNIVIVQDDRNEVTALCGDTCDGVSLSIDTGAPIALYPIKNRIDQYLLLCGYITPRFTDTVNIGAGQKCLDDYRGDHALAITFQKEGKKKILQTEFNNFVLK